MEINSNKEKNIIFEVQLSGISSKELTGYFRLLVDGIEYGFPADITESNISVNIPNLKNIIHRPLREGEKIKSKLEVFGNDNYLLPWSDSVTIKSSVMIEAKIVDEEKFTSKKPMIKATLPTTKKVVENKKVVPVKKVSSGKITMEHLVHYMEKQGTKDKRIQEIILDKCIGKVGDSDNKKLFSELFNYYKKGKN